VPLDGQQGVRGVRGESNEVRGMLQRDNNLEVANEAISDNKVVQDTFKITSNTYC
jgi:hypothetical protein